MGGVKRVKGKEAKSETRKGSKRRNTTLSPNSKGHDSPRSPKETVPKPVNSEHAVTQMDSSPTPLTPTQQVGGTSHLEMESLLDKLSPIEEDDEVSKLSPDSAIAKIRELELSRSTSSINGSVSKVSPGYPTTPVISPASKKDEAPKALANPPLNVSNKLPKVTSKTAAPLSINDLETLKKSVIEPPTSGKANPTNVPKNTEIAATPGAPPGDNSAKAANKQDLKGKKPVTTKASSNPPKSPQVVTRAAAKKGVSSPIASNKPKPLAVPAKQMPAPKPAITAAPENPAVVAKEKAALPANKPPTGRTLTAASDSGLKISPIHPPPEMGNVLSLKPLPKQVAAAKVDTTLSKPNEKRYNSDSDTYMESASESESDSDSESGSNSSDNKEDSEGERSKKDLVYGSDGSVRGPNYIAIPKTRDELILEMADSRAREKAVLVNRRDEYPRFLTVEEAQAEEMEIDITPEDWEDRNLDSPRDLDHHSTPTDMAISSTPPPSFPSPSPPKQPKIQYFAYFIKEQLNDPDRYNWPIPYVERPGEKNVMYSRDIVDSDLSQEEHELLVSDIQGSRSKEVFEGERRAQWLLYHPIVKDVNRVKNFNKSMVDSDLSEQEKDGKLLHALREGVTSAEHMKSRVYRWRLKWGPPSNPELLYTFFEPTEQEYEEAYYAKLQFADSKGKGAIVEVSSEEEAPIPPHHNRKPTSPRTQGSSSSSKKPTYLEKVKNAKRLEKQRQLDYELARALEEEDRKQQDEVRQTKLKLNRERKTSYRGADHSRILAYTGPVAKAKIVPSGSVWDAQHARPTTEIEPRPLGWKVPLSYVAYLDSIQPSAEELMEREEEIRYTLTLMNVARDADIEDILQEFLQYRSLDAFRADIEENSGKAFIYFRTRSDFLHALTGQYECGQVEWYSTYNPWASHGNFFKIFLSSRNLFRIDKETLIEIVAEKTGITPNNVTLNKEKDCACVYLRNAEEWVTYFTTDLYERKVDELRWPMVIRTIRALAAISDPTWTKVFMGPYAGNLNEDTINREVIPFGTGKPIFASILRNQRTNRARRSGFLFVNGDDTVKKLMKTKVIVIAGHKIPLAYAEPQTRKVQA